MATAGRADIKGTQPEIVRDMGNPAHLPEPDATTGRNLAPVDISADDPAETGSSRPGRSSSDRRASSARRSLEQSVKEAAERYRYLVQRIRALGRSERNDIDELKRYLKLAGRQKTRTSAELVEARSQIERICSDLESRFTPSELNDVLVRASKQAVELTAKSPRPQGRGLVPMPLSTLPSCSFLDDFEAGRITLSDALTPPKAMKEPTIGELSPAKLEDARRRRSLLALKGEKSAREAMHEILGYAPCDSEVRWAHRVWERAEDGNGAADIDRRHRRVTVPTVMVPLAQALVLKWYFGRTKASAKQIAKLANDELTALKDRAEREGVKQPLPKIKKKCVAKFLSRLPRSLREVREHGMDGWFKQSRIVDRWDEAQYANDIWEADNSPLDIHAVLSAEQPDVIVDVYSTACIDAYSDVPMSNHVSSQHPDAYTTSMVLSSAIRRHEVAGVMIGGLPRILRLDHGPDFASTHVGRITAALPVKLDYAPKADPDKKPHVERYFRTLNQHLAAYPGYKGEGCSKGSGRKRKEGLLTVDQVIAVVRAFDVEYAKTVQEMRKQTPLERFQNTVKWRDPDNLDDLDLLLLKDDEVRTIVRGAVRFDNASYKGQPITASGHKLLDLNGRKVIVRYHPDIKESVIIYDLETNERYGEFVREDLWKAQRGAYPENKEYADSLREHANKYQRKVEKQDRATAKVERAAETERKVKQRREDDEAAGIRPALRIEKGGKANGPTRQEKRRNALAKLL